MNMAAEYRERLVRTAESAAGVVFAEKALFALLRLKREAVSLCDWSVITPWDGFGMGLRLTLLPTSWRVATVDCGRLAVGGGDDVGGG